MRMWITPAVAIVCTAGLACAVEPVDLSEGVAKVLRGVVEKSKVPGMTGAILKGGKVIGIGAAGVRALGHDEKITTDDAFHLGSCTKAMTATLVATFVEEGKVKWATTIGEVFPEVEMKEAWKSVTLDMLVRNRGGAPANLDKDQLWLTLCALNTNGMAGRDQRLQLVRGVLQWEPEATPGSKFIYSNAGFAIAGAMLEKLSGKVWEDLMRDRIFVPLGITSGGFGAPGDGKAVDQPRGHRGGVPVTPGASADNPAAIGPAGTVHMRIGDWAKFVAAHANGERAEKPTLLKKETYATLHAPWREKGDEREGYAGGWTITKRAWAKGAGKDDWGRVFTHAGSNTMWYCVTWVAPERDFAVVVACNQGGDSAKACDEVAASLVSLAREK